MPPLGMALSGVNFSDLALSIGTGPDGKAILLKYGAFLQSILDFVIIAFVLFLAIRAINRLKKPPVAAAPPRQEVLLEEIRNLLAKR
jgi:large conductance mechanosensitive channel